MTDAQLGYRTPRHIKTKCPIHDPDYWREARRRLLLIVNHGNARDIEKLAPYLGCGESVPTNKLCEYLNSISAAHIAELMRRRDLRPIKEDISMSDNRDKERQIKVDGEPVTVWQDAKGRTRIEGLEGAYVNIGVRGIRDLVRQQRESDRLKDDAAANDPDKYAPRIAALEKHKVKLYDRLLLQGELLSEQQRRLDMMAARITKLEEQIHG